MSLARFRGLLVGLCGLLLLLPHPGQAAPPQAGTVTSAHWQAWRDRFVTEDGRVVDDGNKGISHSEGQGYGMLLAAMANDRAAFTRIWTFTHDQLLLRDDGLAAWRWDPAGKPHITDINDASDGDILIAYALALGGETWNAPPLTAAARDMAGAIGRVLVRPNGGRTLLLPGAAGFGDKDRTDGPVINLSYWVFEAFPVLARLAPEVDWGRLAADGRDLTRQARFGPAQLPADWTSLHGATPQPAAGFPRQFGYDAVRIPLYLLRAGVTDRALLDVYRKAWSAGPVVVRLDDGQKGAAMSDPGYLAVAAVLACVLDGRPFPEALRSFQPTQYYPSTLHLLALAAVTQHLGSCP